MTKDAVVMCPKCKGRLHTPSIKFIPQVVKIVTHSPVLVAQVATKTGRQVAGWLKGEKLADYGVLYKCDKCDVLFTKCSNCGHLDKYKEGFVTRHVCSNCNAVMYSFD
jgi:hypothetical protein